MFVFCCTCVQSTAGESHPLSCMWSGQANPPQTGKDVARSPDQHHCQGIQVPPTWRHYSPSWAKYSCCTFTALLWTSIGCKFLLGQVTLFQELGNGLASIWQCGDIFLHPLWSMFTATNVPACQWYRVSMETASLLSQYSRNDTFCAGGPLS